MVDRRLIRAGLALVVLVSGVGVAQGYFAEPSSIRGNEDVWRQAAADGSQVVEPRENVTVVSALGSRLTNGQLIAYGPDGGVVYYAQEYEGYADVDPEPDGRMTVLYTAQRRLNKSACNATTRCIQNIIERVNLSTGEKTRLYSHKTPYPKAFDRTVERSVRWHDVDRINETHVVVANIARDRVFVLDTSTGLVTWSWSAQNDFPVRSGGPFPPDWTHMNDVEVLEDGRIMVSLRNQDQVVFLDPDTGMVDDWTLGSEDDYGTLYEQHNPDYISADRGGPAVLVADSENNRVVEYQRTDDGEWNQSWVYDENLQWPRDADRLPNGHTLIVSTNTNRLIEIDESNEVVWSVPVRLPYDAERIGTGVESETGESAQRLGLEGTGSDTATGGGESSEGGDAGLFTQFRLFVKGLVPSSLLNGLIFVLPPWMDFVEFGAAVVLVGSLLLWGVLELRWTDAVSVRNPVVVRRDDRD